jgi:hypothetical protein
MGAEVLVATLRLDLYRIDLSRVMAPRIAAAGAVFYPNASRAPGPAEESGRFFVAMPWNRAAARSTG